MTTATRSFYFARALLHDGWGERVRMTVDVHGDIATLAANAERLDGDLAFDCVLPGMPNVHSHAHQRAMAGLAEKAGDSADSFWSWREVMYTMLSRIDPAQLHAIAAQLYVEMLKAGYTSVGEFQYLHHDRDGKTYANPAEMSLQTLHAARAAGIGITNLPVLYRYAGFGEQPPTDAQRRFVNDADAYLGIVSTLVDATRDDPNAATGIAPHSLRAVSVELLETVLAAQLPPAAPVHIHIAEQVQEVHDCEAFAGQRPVSYLLERVAVDERWCLIHATHMDAAENEAVAHAGAVVGVCPTTEASLGDGVFAARAYQHNGGRLAIGSDSHISVSPVEELRWLEYAQRLHAQQRNVLAAGRSSGRTLYEWALRGGAQACGRAVGALEVGRRADFIALAAEHPLLYGRRGDALLDSFVFAGNAPLVRDVVVGGRQVVAGGRHSDEDAIAAAYRQTLNELAA